MNLSHLMPLAGGGVAAAGVGGGGGGISGLMEENSFPAGA